MAGNNRTPIFSFVILGDTHITDPAGTSVDPSTTQTVRDKFTVLLEKIAALEPAFVIHLGDVTHPGPQSDDYGDAANEFHALAATVGVPWYLLPGNHDIGEKLHRALPAIEEGLSICEPNIARYEKHFGPQYQSFSHKGCTFLLLNALLFNSGLADETVQWEWLEETLKSHTDMRLFVCSHYPLFLSDEDEAAHYDNIAEPARSRLASLIREYGVEGVYTGHVHNWFYNRIGGAHHFTLPSTSINRHDYLEFFRTAPKSRAEGFSGTGPAWGGVIRVIDKGLQAAIAEYRKSGLNVMMSMKQAGKPISFVEDCAVALPDLAEYTQKLSDIFTRHGTKGTWYAHASVGCLHVRPVLNLHLEKDVKTMRAIAEEAFELVKQYKGSHSGEHGDGIVRSEFHEKMFGPRIVSAFQEVKARFDPDGLMNPGKIVHAPAMDDRRLFRYGPDYAVPEFETALDWSAWPGNAGGFQGAVEMCNNNGACRKLKGGVMCPSFRATRNERDATRGRANTLRFAISGQIPGGLTSEVIADTMKYCVACKACRRECPTGVDMARMKIEVLAARRQQSGLTLAEKLIGHLPHYAPWAAKVAWLMNLRNRIGPLRRYTEGMTGVSHRRDIPVWSGNPFRDDEAQDASPDVLLFADVFNRYFEPENLRAALRVLRAAGLRIAVARDGSRKALDCGRTFLAVGCIEEARAEARRVIDATREAVARGVPVVGLEPSSILTFRDEFPAICPGAEAQALADAAQTFGEFLAGQPELPVKPLKLPIYVHGHCHQKAQDAFTPMLDVLRRIPGADVHAMESSCCGMAGAFGYAPQTIDISLNMANLDLFPALEAAPRDALVVADGISCRQQIAHGTPRRAMHVARLIDQALHR